jgi:Tfp pilus assembly protein PilX
MRMNTPIDRIRTRLLDQRGVTMIIAMGVMLVTSLLLVGAYASSNGDVHNSHVSTAQKQAYYASLAGIQEYEYQLQANPDYWQKCEEPANTVSTETGERYEIKLLPSSSEPEGTKCSISAPFTTMIESKGALPNTFRIESIGCAGATGLTSCEGQKRSIVAVRKLVATFQVTGFLDFIYFTNFETFDPALYPVSEQKLAKACEGKYRETWSPEGLGCHTITFTTGDSVQGPMHTNDSTRVEGTPSFGRSGHIPTDAVEINGDTYPSKECPKAGGPTYYTVTKCYTDKGPTLIPPESDTSLEAYVEPENRFEGITYLTLNGETNKISVKRFTGGKVEGEEVKEVKQTIEWPKNGLIYVQNNKVQGCSFAFNALNADTKAEPTEAKNCGNVYVEGTYSRSLTIAGENDLIIKGSIVPSTIKPEEEPKGTAVLGLIASEYVRVYHPCEGGENGSESLNGPWIYAGILSTSHSFIVDNFNCGKQLGKLHDYGAIAQDYRGPVGTTGGTGYLKDYKYDNRLATDEPPYFLAPLKAGWRIVRETAPNPG